ncbi:hypothetical protein ABN448_25820 [Delftia acidovorans]|uniref:hypothetical protein n=1 Tax=Delftia acidovorans TaxID=80866 RepID=UPI0032DF750E
MIYGLIPIGGQGSRLGLPYSKEMLPQKNYGFYNPVSNHLVQKMLFAGAEKIVFIHGKSFKQDVVSYYSDTQKFSHIEQKDIGFAQILRDFYLHTLPDDKDQCLFGLPDSIFDGNPFMEMLGHSGICAGLFTTTDSTKVDRLTLSGTRFEVKSPKTENNSDRFWGVIKFDGINLRKFHEDDVFKRTKEIGEIINIYGFDRTYENNYIDIGTWENYNKYLSTTNISADTEIEKKYLANEVDENSFIEIFSKDQSFTYEHINSADYYFSPNNEKIEFIRYREQPAGATFPSDITIKDANPNSLNRFELVIQLSKETKTQSILTFLNLVASQFDFKIQKNCHIFTSNEAVLVLYSFTVRNTTIKLIEIELLQADFNILEKFENLLSELDGFSVANHVNTSKYKMIKEMLNDTTQ